MRNRAELVERSFAHILDRGGMRRTWLRGRENVHKRYLIHVAGHNLGLLMRLLIGAGTPKEAVARGWYFFVLLRTTDGATYAAILEVFVENSAGPALIVFTTDCDHRLDGTTTSSTGCYTGSAAGLLNADTNLSYAVPYLANAYRVAGGNENRTVSLYASGFYYHAKRKGMLGSLTKGPSGGEPEPEAQAAQVPAQPGLGSWLAVAFSRPATQPQPQQVA